MNKIIFRNTFILAASFILAFLFCLKFSVTTSPLYHIDCADSAIFSVIGKYWAEGSIPYVDLWDHKGPVIFFINCLGFSLTGNELGVFLIQVLSLGFSVFFTFKTFYRKFNPTISFLLTCITLFWLACSYEGGNLTEEYLLPYLSAAIYGCSGWIESREENGRSSGFNPWLAFLLGLILAFSFLTRLTNALGACGIMLGIGVILIFDKQWKTLWLSSLAFVAGFLFLAVPFFIYFHMHGALDDMLFGTFYYNLSNINMTTEKNSSIAILFTKDRILFWIMAANCLVLVFVSVLNVILDKNHRVGSFIWFCAASLLALWYLRCEPMSHYRTVAVPFFPILVMETWRLRNTHFSVVSYVVLACLLFGPIFLTLRKFNSFVDYYEYGVTRDRVLVDGIRNVIPERERDSLMLYSCPPALYLSLDLKPCYHNFSLPETQSIKSEELKQDILREFSSLKAKWLLCPSDHVLISGILNESYELIYRFPEYQQYTLWRLKTSVLK